MSNLSARVKSVLKPGKGLVVILTVGNNFRRDDGVGNYIAEHLSSNNKLKIIKAEINPENFIFEISSLKPEKVIIIDCADFGGKPGEAKIISESKIPSISISTHLISMKVLAKLIKEEAKTKVLFLGIQPTSINYGEGLSLEVKKTADKIISIIKKEFCNA